jgi:hypothetical protein
MTAPEASPGAITFAYQPDGEVRCQNPHGLVFFLHAAPPALRHEPREAPARR